MNRIKLVLAFLLAMLPALGFSALTAGFTATPTSGCAPLLVSFTNTTTPAGGTTYSWTFGSSGTSTYTNPSTSFLTPGTHLVTLVATNGSETSTYTMSITVYPQPTVNFVASDTTVCPGTPVSFTSTTVSGVPGPMTYTWSFGDGTTTTAAAPVHTYTAPGSYTVSLYGINAEGCSASVVKTAYITVASPPSAHFTWSPGGVCNPPGTVTFTSTSIGPPPISCSWSFGDGTLGSGTPVSHMYTAVGSYNVHLTVTDGNGCVDSVTLGPVRADTIRADFTGPDTICVFSTASFTNTSSPHTGRTWSYGDGSTSAGLDGSHAFSTPGNYTVTLTTTMTPCTATIQHPIVVLPGPTADFTASPTIPCPAPVSVTYDGTGTAGISYDWIFEGGATATGSSASHYYTTNGVKTIKMIVTDPLHGCRDTVVKTDTIYDLEFQASATPVEGCAPLDVLFSGIAITHVPYTIPLSTYTYPVVPVASYSWDFGDGTTPGTSATPSHTYTAPGVYFATVTATTTNGCSDTDVVRIDVGEPPVVTFTATPTHVCYGTHTPIVFTPTIVTGPVDEYDWSFGDGGTVVHDTTDPPHDVSHVYTLPGTFDVTVTPYYRGCPGAPYTIHNYITVDSPKAIINDSIMCDPATRVLFFDQSLGDDSHLWIFGDGTTSTADNPVHDFPSAGSYMVKLATYNAGSGCRDTAALPLTLYDLTPDILANRTSLCRGDTTKFTAAITGGLPTTYSWFVDGVTIASITPTFIHNFPTNGLHTVRLIISDDNGCLDTMTHTDFVLVSSPTVAFSGSPVSGCSPLTVTYTDASTATTGTSITSHLWTFAPGVPPVATAGLTASYTYTTAGTYSVKEVAIDNIGCKDSLTQPAYIHVFHPTASFTVSMPFPCIGAPVTFSSTSSGSPTSFAWDFGDGTTGTSASATHNYSATGTYNVMLTVTDANGCTDAITMPAAATVTKPTASFNMSDSISVCPPLSVNFYNTSTAAITYNWGLGDGTTSSLYSPTNLYLTPGLYTVSLVATNVHGCKDTAYNTVNIFGYAGAFTYTPTQGCVPLAVHFSATLSNVPFITWDYSDGSTSSISYTDTITHIYTTPGAYVPKLLLTDNTGCQNSSLGTDTIFVDAVTTKFSTDPNPVCPGVPFTFIDSSTTYWSPIVSWDWTYDGKTSTLTTPSDTIYTQGTYPVTLVVTNGWGCTDSITKNVTVVPPPNVTVSPDTIVCVGDAAVLTGYGAQTYVWDPPATLSCTTCNPTNASPSTATTYTVVGTDESGCIDSATVTVGTRTHTISNAWGDTAVCFGVPVQLHDTGGNTYVWIPPLGLNNANISDPIATAPYTIVYTVVATLGSCIPDTQSVTVVIYPLPTVDAGPDQRLLAGSTAQLHAKGTNIATYEWTPAGTLSCPDCADPVASMSVMTTYNVSVKSSHGCRADDSVRVLLYCDNSQVFIPNAFTPNGDGKNDVFYPRGQGIKTITTFRIYNRWGEMLFERTGVQLNDESMGWDGSYKGGSPKPDVYVYIMEGECYTGEPVFIKGDVTILR